MRVTADRAIGAIGAIGLAGALGAGCLGSSADFVAASAEETGGPALVRVTQPVQNPGESKLEAANDAPPYPEGPYGYIVGDVAPPFAVAGDGPDDAWTSETLWAWGQYAGGPRILALALLSDSCHCCLHEAPVLQSWHARYGPDGLFVLGVGTGMTPDYAEEFWLEGVEHDHPWAADPTFAMFPWSDPAQTGMAASPSVTFVDLSTMRIVGAQMGQFSGGEAIFEPLLAD